jgi:hypothetical protein
MKIYLGGYWVCQTWMESRNKQMKTCQTKGCSNYIDPADPYYTGNGNGHFEGFCPKCGTKIKNIPIPLKYPAPEIKKEPKGYQIRSHAIYERPKGWPRVEGVSYDVWYPLKGVLEVKGVLDLSNHSFDILGAKEKMDPKMTEWLNQQYKDQVTISYGLIQLNEDEEEDD